MEVEEYKRLALEYLEAKELMKSLETRLGELSKTLISNEPLLAEVFDIIDGDQIPLVVRQKNTQVDPRIWDALPEAELALFGKKEWKHDLKKLRNYIKSHPDAAKFLIETPKVFVKVSRKKDARPTVFQKEFDAKVAQL